MRVQFPAAYHEGQAVETEDGQVVLDADLRAELTEPAYFALQQTEPGIRFAPQSFSRGKPIGSLGRVNAAEQRAALGKAAALLQAKADSPPSKAQLL